MQHNVDLSISVITPEGHRWSSKVQALFDVLLSTTLFAVEFYFLFFFDGLLEEVAELDDWVVVYSGADGAMSHHFHLVYLYSLSVF